MKIYLATSFEDMYGLHLSLAGIRKRLANFACFSHKGKYYSKHLPEYIETGRIIRATGRTSNASQQE